MGFVVRKIRLVEKLITLSTAFPVKELSYVKRAIVPKDFVVPVQLKTSRCIFQPLTQRDVVRDYDAVMSSEDFLRNVFNPKSAWPTGS